MLARYRPSGRTSTRMIPAALIASVLGTGLAWPYQALVSRVPYLLIAGVVYVVFLAAIAAVVVAACAYGHNRNRWLGALLGVLVAISAVGASHYVAYRRVRSEMFDAVSTSSKASPTEVEAAVDDALTFGTYIDLRVQTGWALGKTSSEGEGEGDIVGPLVWLVWALEALAVIIVAAGAGRRGRPFCERCKHSLRAETLFVRDDLDLSDLGVLTAAPSAATLVDIPPRGWQSVVGLRVTYACAACTTCDGDAYLTVTSALPDASGRDRDGKVLHREVALARVDYNRLLVLRDRLVYSGPTATRT